MAGQSANKTEQLVKFRLRDAQRINSAVLAYETSRRGRQPSTLPRAAGGGGGSGIEVVWFTGAWPKNSEKIVYYEENMQGTATAQAMNILCSITPQGAPRRAIVANTAYYTAGMILVNAEC